MFCSVCGADNPDDSRYCSVCGAELNSMGAAPEPQDDDYDDTPTEILTGPDPGSSAFSDQKTVSFSGNNTAQQDQTGYLMGNTGYLQGQTGQMPGKTGILPGNSNTPVNYGGNKKKKTAPWLYVLIGVAAVAVIAAVVVVLMMNGKDKDSNATEVAGSTVQTTQAVETTEKSEETTEKTTEKTTEATTEEKVAEAHVTYRTYVQDKGWLEWAKDGKEAGTQGESKRIEAFQMKLEGLKHVDGGITYRAYVTDAGWLDWVSNTDQAGKKGEGKSVEAIEVKLTGEVADAFDVYYCVYAQGQGWLGWAKNGESAGTNGGNKRAECIKIQLVDKKKGKAPKSEGAAFVKIEEKKDDEKDELSQEELVAMYKGYRDILNADDTKKDAAVAVAMMDVTGDSVPELIYETAVAGDANSLNLNIVSYSGGEVKQLYQYQFNDTDWDYFNFTRKGDNTQYQCWIKKGEIATTNYFKLVPNGSGGYGMELILGKDVADGQNVYHDSGTAPIDEAAFNSAESDLLGGIDKVVTRTGDDEFKLNNGNSIKLSQYENVGGSAEALANYLSSFIGE